MVIKGGRFEVSDGFDDVRCVLGLAEIFLQKDEEMSVAGYVWYGRNREGVRRLIVVWECWRIGILELRVSSS